MLRFIKAKKWWFVGIVAVGGGIFYMVSSGGNGQVNYDTAEADYVDIVQEVSVTGTVEADPKVSLRFQSVGQIEEIFVEVGDFIKSGQSLARLDSTALGIKVSAAEADLALAQSKYDQAMAGSTDEAVAVAQASYKKSQADLEQARQSFNSTTVLSEASVAAAELSYQSALTDYDNAVLGSDEDVRHAYEDAYNVIDQVFCEVEDTLRDMDNILGVDDETANDDFELALKAYSLSEYNNARDLYEDVSDLRDSLYSDFSGVGLDDYDTINGMLEDCADLLDNTDYLLDDVDYLLVDSPIIGGYTSAVRDAKRVIVSGEMMDINTVSTSLDNASQSVDSAMTGEDASLSGYANALAQAEQAYEIAQAQASADVAGAEVSVSVYEALLAQAEANLADVEAGPRDVDLASLEAAIDSAQAALNLAQYNLSEAYLTAPSSGVITEINFEKGENVTATDEFLVMISDTYQITANVSETDVTKVHVGEKVMMTLDAFSYDKEFEAEIVQIDPAETIVQGVIYYQIKAVFIAVDTEVKPGMTANMDIVTAEVSDVLAIPLRAVKYDGSRTYVLVPDGEGGTSEVDVEIGVEGDQYVEILSGVEKGDFVVTYVR